LKSGVNHLLRMVVWRSALVSINEVNLCWAGFPVSTGIGDCVRVQFPALDIYLGM